MINNSNRRRGSKVPPHGTPPPLQLHSAASVVYCKNKQYGKLAASKEKQKNSAKKNHNNIKNNLKTSLPLHKNKKQKK